MNCIIVEIGNVQSETYDIYEKGLTTASRFLGSYAGASVIDIDKRMTPQEIQEIYLQMVRTGDGLWNVEAAFRTLDISRNSLLIKSERGKGVLYSVISMLVC